MTNTDVEDQQSRRRPYSVIVGELAKAQKKRTRGAPAYSIYVNRKVGRFIAAAAYKSGLTPNAVTTISAAFSACAILTIALVKPTPIIGVAIWLLLAIGYAFDSADGQLARLLGGGTVAGEWLDHVVDATKISSLHLAVLVCVYRFYDLPSTWLLLIPIGFCIVGAVVFFIIILNEQLKGAHGRTAQVSGNHSTPLRALVAAPMDYGLLCLVFALLGFHVAFFMLYSLLFVANAVYLLIAGVKWFKDMTRLGATA